MKSKGSHRDSKEAFSEGLGEFFKKKREVLKKTQKEASDFLGYSSPQFISNFERGLCGLPLNKLKKLGDFYGISVKQLSKVIMDAYRRYLEQELKTSKKNHA
ncbi:MAG: helix-turn-helix transcriptional regulator [Deltaproteobacteria bacterium]|nr:helix-turn-helix transcriptional regulator [Deltaproteobacteria bacterium]